MTTEPSRPVPLPGSQIIPDTDWPLSRALGSALVLSTPIIVEIFKFRSTFSVCLSTNGYQSTASGASRLGGARHEGSRAVTRQARSRVGPIAEGMVGKAAEAETRKGACAPGLSRSCSSHARSCTPGASPDGSPPARGAVSPSAAPSLAVSNVGA